VYSKSFWQKGTFFIKSEFFSLNFNNLRDNTMKYLVLRWNSPLRKMAKTIFKLKLSLYLKNRNFRFFDELHFLRITIYPKKRPAEKLKSDGFSFTKQKVFSLVGAKVVIWGLFILTMISQFMPNLIYMI
jgi:hypothetical protein